jgi:hypothetical protein
MEKRRRINHGTAMPDVAGIPGGDPRDAFHRLVGIIDPISAFDAHTHIQDRHHVAKMLRGQLSMGPIGSTACGFTDARFVEMLAAKYGSLRLAVADALALLVDDRYSTLYQDFDTAGVVAQQILFDNPSAVHHMPGRAGKP